MTFRTTTLWILSIFCGTLCACSSTSNVKEDSYLWLENVDGQKAVTWAQEQSQETNKVLTHSNRFQSIKDHTLEFLQSSNLIPNVKILGDHYYILWRSEKHPRGLWKRKKISKRWGDPIEWETVLDIDRLAKKEKKPWMLEDVVCLKPTETLCLLGLSKAGTEAVVYREFNTKSKRFVKNGYEIPYAKTKVRWIDRHHLLLSSDFGNNTLTLSGYGRLGKVWKRGTSLKKARTVFEIPKEFPGMEFKTYYDGGQNYTIAQLHKGLRKKQFLYAGKNFQRPINIPSTARILNVFSGYLIFEIRNHWKKNGREFKKGEVLALNTQAFGKKITKEDLKVVYTPEPETAILNVKALKTALIFTVLEDVKTKVIKITTNNDRFDAIQLKLASSNSVVTLLDSSRQTNDLLFKAENFLKASRLYYYSANTNKKSLLKSLTGQFKTKGMVFKQYWAKSADGTKVPYFLVGKKSVIKTQKAPTILYGYGALQKKLLPHYDPILGRNWLEKGGLFVLANIRGGGELGPDWHQATLKSKRKKTYEDFIGVAKDLLKRKITIKKKLGIRGKGSGGLLVTAVMVKKPQFFAAVAASNPLTDMLRYTEMHAGARWVSEYGDPQMPKERSYLLKHSPFHNLEKEKNYPPTLFYASQTNDRIHPGHARKMVFKMKEINPEEVFYYENQQGGHSTMVNLEEEAHRRALIYEFFHKYLFTDQ